MKKLVLFIIALFAGFLTVSAQSNISLYEKYKQESTNIEYPQFETHKLSAINKAKSGQDWWKPDTVYCVINSCLLIKELGVYRNVFEYNSQGLLTAFSEQWLTNNSWDNIKYSITYSYDSNLNLQTKQEQYFIWKGGERINLTPDLYTYTYDSNLNILTTLTQNWKNNLWENYSLIINTYDLNNNLLTSMTQNWKNNLWENSSQTINTYDSNNNLLTGMTQNWKNNLWENSSQTINTYDLNNNLLTNMTQNWKNNLWENSSQTINTYDSNNNLLTNMTQNWKNNLWENSSQTINTYDSNNNLLNRLQKFWSNNSWENYGQYLMTYDENANTTTSEYFTWIDGSWLPGADPLNITPILFFYYNNMKSVFVGLGTKMTISYIKVSDLSGKEKIKTTPPIQIHSEGKTIHINNQTGKNAVITVYRIDGVKVTEQTTKSQITALEMPLKGLYLVSVKAEDEKPVTEKVVIK